MTGERVQRDPWDRRLARVLVRPLAGTPVTPNLVTLFGLFLALLAAVCFAFGSRELANWGAGFFMLARLVDHMDGELARLTGTSSLAGARFDMSVDVISHVVLFIGLGIGFSDRVPGVLLTGLVVLASAASGMNSVIQTSISARKGVRKPGFPTYGGFQLDDGIYLIGPMTWAGFLFPFFIACAVGAICITWWMFWDLVGRRWVATRRAKERASRGGVG